MRKIYSIMFAAVAIFTAASCQKEITGAPEVKGEPFTLKAIRDTETKTVMTGDKSVSWTVGDKLIVFNAEAKGVEFVNTAETTQASAMFYAETYDIPTTGSIIAIYPDNKTAVADDYKLSGTTVTNLRIGGKQKAIAGTFDPAFGVAYAHGTITDFNTPPTLEFKNIHSLVKFTIAEDSEIPTSVSLTTNGEDNFAGGGVSYDGENITLGQYGAKTVTLSGTFEAGKTYYFSVWPVECKGGLTLSFNNKEVKTTKDVTLQANKIYDLGTASIVTAPEKDPEYETDFAKRVWGKYADTNDGWIIMGAGNLDRGMAMDKDYIYVSKSTAYAPVIKVFDYEGNEVKEVNVTGMGSSNSWGDAMQYSVNCVRTMPKADGSSVLIACNLKLNDSHILQVWAWPDGIDAAPTCIARYGVDNLANATDHRRYGDRFNITGTWEDGYIWFPSSQADDHGKTVVFSVKNGTVTGHADKQMGPLYYYRMEPTQSTFKDTFFYKDSDEAFMTGNKVAKFVKKDGTVHSTGWINWVVTNDYTTTHNLTYGYNTFEANGKDYIAYVKVEAANGNKARLVVIQDGDGTLEGFKAALTNNVIVFEAPLHHTSSFETGSLCYTGNSIGNCYVVTKDGVTYIGAHAQGLGLSLFQIK